MDSIKRNMNVLLTPARTGYKIGVFMVNKLTRDHVSYLMDTEPSDRAERAIGGAERAAKRGDDELVLFEVLRATNAIEEVGKHDAEKASEIGPRLADVAINQLPDNDLGARVAEQAVAKGLKSAVDTIDANVVRLPRQRSASGDHSPPSGS